MYILEDKIYLHFQKTGGFSVYEIIKKLGLKKVWFKEHNGIVTLPEQYKHLRRFTFIRNPYSWYVSFFFFHEAMRLKRDHTGWINPFLRTLTSKNIFHFNQFIHNSCNLKKFYIENPAMYEELIKQFHIVIKFKNKGWVGTWFKDSNNIEKELAVDNLDMTLMDWYMNIMGLNEPNTTIYKLENFKEGIEIEFGPIEEIPHKHKSKHNDYRHYYNEESISKVNASHSHILDKFGYQFEKI